MIKLGVVVDILSVRGLPLLLVLFGALSAANAQQRPYIGYVYPAGGQQGTTFSVRVGGQAIDDTQGVLVTGKGISAKLAENYRRLNNQEMQLLNEQLSVLKRSTMSKAAREMVAEENPAMMMMADDSSNPMDAQAGDEARKKPSTNSVQDLIKKIEDRTFEFVANPACASISSIMILEVTISPDAEPGPRELRLLTSRGVSNPLPFYAGDTPELSKKPMRTASKQILGKEAQALRRRDAEDSLEKITLPCTVNGQIGSGEVNRYTFQAREGQKLVINTLARQLVPFIADAVPGWFQPVLALYDANGNEVAYNDDFRFKPDPVLLYEVPRDGEYSFTIRDSLYRGREDFVYRITIGETPFITSIHPLGRQQGTQEQPAVKGWNLEGSTIQESPGSETGTCSIIAKKGSLTSNRVPFALDDLPDAAEKEPNNTAENAQAVTLPCFVNGRIERSDDWDVYELSGRSNDVVVAEVHARRLDSPLDSILKATDANGTVLALNDDTEDLAAGIQTHQADAYVRFTLPADGKYYVHIGDTARQGGEAFSYRLRLSAPRPGFELRLVPSSMGMRSKSSASLKVYAVRKDGFEGPIKLGLKDPPKGFFISGSTLAPTQNVGQVTIRSELISTPEPVSLRIIGTTRLGDQTIESEAIASEDQMQAFLWRHLVPASDLKVFVFDPSLQPRPRRMARMLAAAKTAQPSTPASVTTSTNASGGTNLLSGTNTASLSTNAAPNRPRFTQQQVAGRLRQLKLLFEEGMLTDNFYADKVAECEAME